MRDKTIQRQEDILLDIEKLKKERDSENPKNISYLIMREADLVYTVEEVAAIIKTNKNFVYDLIRKGYITALKLGRLKITKAELLRFLKENNGKDFSDLDNVVDLKVI